MPLHTAEADKIVGHWISPQKDIIVECYKTPKNEYHGKLVWFKTLEGKSRYDCEVPEDKWINRDILWGFSYDDDEWNDGKIKDLKKCNTYDAYITIKEQELTVTGFIALRWLGESMVFTRYEGDLPVQH